MNLEDLKTAWQELNARVETQETTQRQLLMETRLNRARSKLNRLIWRRGLEIAFWGAAILFLGSFSVTHADTPHLLAAGLILHIYALLALAANVAQICLQVRIDYAEPIVTIQSRLSKLRRFRVLSELILGLPWFVLWIPALMVLAKSILGLDIYSPIQPVWHASVGVGFGLMGIAVWLARHYAGRPAGSRCLDWLRDELAGETLAAANREIDEIAEFERE